MKFGKHLFDGRPQDALRHDPNVQIVRLAEDGNELTDRHEVEGGQYRRVERQAVCTTFDGTVMSQAEHEAQLIRLAPTQEAPASVQVSAKDRVLGHLAPDESAVFVQQTAHLPDHTVFLCRVVLEQEASDAADHLRFGATVYFAHPLRSAD